MVTIQQVKLEFEKRKIRYSEELTSGNFDDKGKRITEKIPTLTTEFFEIGFYTSTIYFVTIAKSNCWSEKFYTEIQQFKNIQIYGLKNFKKNYSLSTNPEKIIQSEPYFQVQFNYDVKRVSIEKLFSEYEQIIELFERNKIEIVNQLENII